MEEECEMQAIEEREDEFCANLEALDDPLLQYEYLLSFVGDLDELSKAECCEQNQVKGCTSNAWMVLKKHEGRLHVRMNADSLIIKGMLGVVAWMLDGHLLAEVTAWQPRFLEDPQVRTLLNVDRRFGMASIVCAIQEFCMQQ